LSVLEKPLPMYDKSGEQHFNLISALHKAVRGSDVEGSLYWLARMLAGGEDPLYVARRVVRIAAEDVGLADPRALSVALAAKDAYVPQEYLPEVLRGQKWYEPTEFGFEKDIKKRMEWWENLKREWGKGKRET